MLQQWLLSLLTIIVGALIGGYLTHFLSSRRDIAVKRREIILPNLMLAIEELEQANTSKAGSDLKKLEKVVSRIQLVGDADLVNISRAMVSDITERGNAETTELYFALRDRIRKELKLSKLQKKYMALAITFPQDKGQDK